VVEVRLPARAMGALPHLIGAKLKEVPYGLSYITGANSMR
jgi:hypothetical protein